MKNSNNIKLNSKNFDDVLNNIIQEVTNPMEQSQSPYQKNEINEDIIEIQPDQPSLLNKLDVMTLNNGWNDKNEKIIISIGENASSYKWMHERCASTYKLIHKIFSVVLILFSTGLSAESIIPNDENNQAISILRRVFTYIITVLSVIQNFLKMEQLSEQHMSAATRFSELYHEIQQQMCMFRRDRNNATEYLSTVLKKYDSLVVAGPSINTIVLNQFKNTFRNAEISIPDIADRIQKIEIITEPSTQNYNQKQNPTSNNNDSFIPRLLSLSNANDNNNNNNANIEGQSQKRYAKYGNSNLKQIHDVFKIHGDFTDSDLQNANNIELKELRKKFLQEKSSFEFERFKNHNNEND